MRESRPACSCRRSRRNARVYKFLRDESHCTVCLHGTAVWLHRSMSSTRVTAQNRHLQDVGLLIRLCQVSVLFLLQLFVSFSRCCFFFVFLLSSSHSSVLPYLYPNGFYHLRSYFPKLNVKPLLPGKCNKTTAGHYSPTQ